MAATSEVYIAYYRRQTKGELITSGNQLVVPEDWKWKQIGGWRRQHRMGRAPVEQADRADLTGLGSALQAYRFYWVGGAVTSSRAWRRRCRRGRSFRVAATTPR